MKIRNGFVSNSSSSSFICEVCGQVECGYDISLSDCQMYECVHGHIFCEYHVEDFDKKEFCLELIKNEIIKYQEYQKKYGGYEKDIETAEKALDDLMNENNDYDDYDEIMNDYDYRYSFPEKYCPICSLSDIRAEDALNYLLKITNRTKDEIDAEIREKYNSLQDFNENLNK
jgi:hypothetical protein